MRPDRERQLHDYLDGRLSEAERQDFEAAMERDPSLAARMACFRGIGAALRGESDGLGEAFYDTARERFEASRRPRLAWLWGWEAASLLAAAALVFALFLPTIFDDGLPNGAAGSSPTLDESDPVEPAAKLEQLGRTQAEHSASTEPRTAIAKQLLADDGRVDRLEVEGKGAGVASDADEARAQRSEKSKELKDDVSAPAAEAIEGPTPRNAQESGLPSARARSRKRALTAVARLTRAPPTAIASPTTQEWSRMVNEPGFEALLELGRPSDDRRLLWVGSAIDCDRLMASIDADGWRIELHPGVDIACALVVPADGLAVRTVAGAAP